MCADDNPGVYRDRLRLTVLTLARNQSPAWPYLVRGELFQEPASHFAALILFLPAIQGRGEKLEEGYTREAPLGLRKALAEGGEEFRPGY